MYVSHIRICSSYSGWKVLTRDYFTSTEAYIKQRQLTCAPCWNRMLVCSIPLICRLLQNKHWASEQLFFHKTYVHRLVWQMLAFKTTICTKISKHRTKILTKLMSEKTILPVSNWPNKHCCPLLAAPVDILGGSNQPSTRATSPSSSIWNNLAAPDRICCTISSENRGGVWKDTYTIYQN